MNSVGTAARQARSQAATRRRCGEQWRALLAARVAVSLINVDSRLIRYFAEKMQIQPFLPQNQSDVRGRFRARRL